MIIKKWNGSSWDVEYPRTIVDNIYTGDGATQIFDPATDKILEAYLPDAAFGNMRFLEGIDPSNASYDSLSELWTRLSALESTTSKKVGCYFIASDAGVVSENAGANEFVTDGDSVINAGDWIVLQSLGAPNLWVVVNNTYGTAGDGVSGTIQLGHTDVKPDYAVKLASNKAYVSVPWTDTQVTVETSAASGHDTQAISSGWAYGHAQGTGNGQHVPSAGSGTQFLKGDGTWDTPAYTTALAYTAITGRPTALSDLSNDLDYDDFGAQVAGSYAADDHGHGRLLTGGTFAADTSIQSGDKIVITDQTDGGIARSAIAFGSNDGTFLRKDGTWQGVTVESHAHGNVSWTGTMTDTAAFAAGDSLVVRTPSTNVIKTSTITFGAGNTYLRNNGSWDTPANDNTEYTAHTQGGLTLESTTEFRMTNPIYHGTVAPTMTSESSGYALWFDTN